jgi:acetyl esterase
MIAPLLAAALLIGPPAVRAEPGLHYGAGPQRELDAFVVSGARRAIVLIHGGGWHAGSKDSLDATARRFAGLGWDAFSISYRLVPPSPWYAARDDAFAAVAWVRAHARRFGFDPRRLAVFGTSAGGNLAALIATVGHGRERVAAAVSWSGPMDLAGMSRNADVRRYADGHAAALSPATFVSSGDAPIFLSNSTHELVPLQQATAMAAKLSRAGVTHRLLIVPGSLHAVAYESQAWLPTLAFLQLHVP